MIEVKKLVKRFGLKAVLRGLDFRVERGEFVALLGPNGAGKTTFLRILSTLARPSLGETTPRRGIACRTRLRRCAPAWVWSRTCPCSTAI